MSDNALPIQRLAFRVVQAASITGLSRSSIYRLIEAGELDLIKVGRRASAITRESILRYAVSRGIPLPTNF